MEIEIHTLNGVGKGPVVFAVRCLARFGHFVHRACLRKPSTNEMRTNIVVGPLLLPQKKVMQKLFVAKCVEMTEVTQFPGGNRKFLGLPRKKKKAGDSKEA